jgi:hypothetical protein
MTGKYSGEPHKILSKNEKEFWLEFLRSDAPLDGERKNIARILEAYFKLEDHARGHRPMFEFQQNRERSRLIALSNLVYAEMEFADKSYAQAVNEVARREDISPTSFKKDLGKLNKLIERTTEPESPDEQEANELSRESHENFRRMAWKQWRERTTKR